MRAAAYILTRNVRIQKFERGLKREPKNKDTSTRLRISCLLDLEIEVATAAKRCVEFS